MSELVLVTGTQYTGNLGITASGAHRSAAEVWPAWMKSQSRSALNNI